MHTSEVVKAPAAEGAWRRSLADRLPRWLIGWRGLVILGILLVAAGLYAGWGWLAAVGLAPIILALAPCAAMCAIGACAMSRGASRGATQTTADTADPAAPSAADRFSDSRND